MSLPPAVGRSSGSSGDPEGRPTSSQAETLWQKVVASLAVRRPVVVATVVRESGSVPRRSGAKMLVYPDGSTCGTVGGGAFEQCVIRDALAALHQGTSRIRGYSFNPAPAGASGDTIPISKQPEIGSCPRDETFGAVCGGRAELFLEVVMPADRLLIVGGGHCGRALAQAASLLDFSIVVADDREAALEPQNFAFSGVEALLHLSSDSGGLPEPDAQTYVVVLTKGHLSDTEALRRVIRSPAAYIGMIGSARKREVVFEKLRAEGIAPELLARVHVPIGLEIGADSPAEIAVSILAEIIQERARRRNSALTPAQGA